MKPLADLLGVLVLFLAMTATFPQPIGAVAFRPPAPVDDETLTIGILSTELTIAMGGDPPRTFPRSVPIDRRWLGAELSAWLQFRPKSAALTVDDDVTVDDLIRVADACHALGLSTRLRSEPFPW